MLDVKIGDQVVGETHGDVPRVLTVIRLTKTLAVMSDDTRVFLKTGYEYGSRRLSPMFFRAATPSDIERWEAHQIRQRLLRVSRERPIL